MRSPTRGSSGSDSLNAPYGARCFLTRLQMSVIEGERARLNAPYGARCFLTIGLDMMYLFLLVLMHLMALGAF